MENKSYHFLLPDQKEKQTLNATRDATMEIKFNMAGFFFLVTEKFSFFVFGQ